jgi:hypothetical protein
MYEKRESYVEVWNRFTSGRAELCPAESIYFAFKLLLLFYYEGLISLWLYKENNKLDRAIAQAVRGRLPTAAARVQNRVWSCGIL